MTRIIVLIAAGLLLTLGCQLITIPALADEDVYVNPMFMGIPVIMEDQSVVYVPLEGYEGMFVDPENDFSGFDVWNKSKDGWDQTYDSSSFRISIENYAGIWSAAISTHWNMHGSESVMFRAYDAVSSVNLTTIVVIRSVNDPPRVMSVTIGTTDHTVDNTDPLRPVLHLEETVEILEDEEIDFRINAVDTDPPEDSTSLEYSYVRSLSNEWDEEPDVNYETGEVTFIPTNNDVRASNSKMVFQIDDHGENGDVKFELFIKVTNVNDPPVIMIPTTAPRTWKQFSKISIRPITVDEDKNDQITISVNFQEAIGDHYNSIEDQLPYMNATRGIEWDINNVTGEFWFWLNDQNIWKTEDGMVKQQEIKVVFMATDNEGGSDLTSINLILDDENEEPEKPDEIFCSPTYPEVGWVIHFWVDPVTDPDEDQVKYLWDFGDGHTAQGQHVNHSFLKSGYKTVQVWVEDEQFQTEKISYRIEIGDTGSLDPNGDQDGDGYNNSIDAFPRNANEWKDTDSDGVGDNSDVFPEDPAEWADSDADTYGDNTDAFPSDPTEWNDTDEDGVGDHGDAFPSDPAASIDTDYDGFPDEWNSGMSEDSSTTGLTLDHYPNDFERHNKMEEDDGSIIPIVILISVISLILIALLIIIISGVIIRNRERTHFSEDIYPYVQKITRGNGGHLEREEREELLETALESNNISRNTYEEIKEEVFDEEDRGDIWEIKKGEL